ncbi:MAG: hypothetical protein IJR14_01570 [Synergistaceae bacterium]|nr:hypothetical protein [Synergistaceae bacterium]
MPHIFPTPQHENLVICVTGIGASNPFSALMTDCMPNLHTMDTGQCFPLYWYEESDAPEDMQGHLFDEGGAPVSGPIERKWTRRDAISDEALELFQEQYANQSITKEQIFWYIYGVLHSPEYRERFDADVKKMLARVPLSPEFWAFEKAGRALAGLHVGYERVERWPVQRRGTEGSPGTLREGGEMHRVEKMKIIQVDGRKAIRCNEDITIADIPDEAWQYVVNGKSALEWIVERYRDGVDKASGLRNDCNAWGREREPSDPCYVVDLIERVVRVSVETVRIVRGLPPLGIVE